MTDTTFGPDDPVQLNASDPALQLVGNRRQGIAAPVIFAVAGRLLRGLAKGSLRLVLRNGEARTFSGPADGALAEIRINSPRLLWLVLRRGSIGFADA